MDAQIGDISGTNEALLSHKAQNSFLGGLLNHVAKCTHLYLNVNILPHPNPPGQPVGICQESHLRQVRSSAPPTMMPNYSPSADLLTDLFATRYSLDTLIRIPATVNAKI